MKSFRMTKSVRLILKPKYSFTVNGSLWIECNGERFFGPGPMELLERIIESGSISQAAKGMNMSYKKAWELINRLNAGAVTPLVVTSPGGKDGGGSVVSDEARELIKAYRNMREAFSRFLQKESVNFNNK